MVRSRISGDGLMGVRETCSFCGKETERAGRAFVANPFCSGCYEQRLEASGAVDMRDNWREIDFGNGYSRIEAIDRTKLWKAAAK